MRKPYQLITVLLFIFTRQISADPLAGLYTIGGVNSNYPTIGAAVDDLHANGISAPVTFGIHNGTYNEQITIGNFTRTGNADDLVTFRKLIHTTVNWEFSEQAVDNNWVLRLDGAQYITVSGIIFNAVTPIFSTLIKLDGDTSNNTILDCDFNGNLSSGSLIVLPVSKNNRNLIFRNNSFIRGNAGIAFGTLNNGTFPTGVEILDNTFTSQSRYAIVLSTDGALIKGNNIFATTISSPDYQGLLIRDSTVVIENNIIHMTKGTLAMSLSRLLNNLQQGARIVNNMITLRLGPISKGIFVDLKKASIYHNTVRSDISIAPALHVDAGTQSVRIHNNLFINDAGGLTMQIDNRNSITSSNHNNLYTTGNTVAQLAGQDYATLSNYSDVSGLDLDSTSVAVTFIDITGINNLHLSSPSINDESLLATRQISVDVDIDGDIRSLGSVGMQVTFKGADEGNIPNIVTYSVGGTITGLNNPDDLVMSMNNNYDFNISTINEFSFTQELLDHNHYDVTIESEPPNKICTLINSSGSINGLDIQNIEVTCLNETDIIFENSFE